MYNFLFWFNIALSLFCAYFNNFIQATVFLGIAALWYATELIIKEIRNVSKPKP